MPPPQKVSTPPHKQLPRHAAVASAPSAQQYQDAQRRAAKSIALRKRLPTTQVDFYAQRAARFR